MAGVKETGLGILFFGALIGLGALTIALTDFDLFEQKHRLFAYFDEGSGLKPGDNVRVMGVIRGKVEEVEFLSRPVRLAGVKEDLWVKATLKMDVPLEKFLKSDYSLTIRNANLLGGKVVEIELGSKTDTLPGEILKAGIPGFAKTDPFEEIGDMIAENREMIDSIFGNIETFSSKASDIAAEIQGGEGVVHDLIYDAGLGARVRETFDRASSAAAEIEAIVQDVKDGRGVVGQAIYNKEWPQNVSSVLNGARDIVETVQSKEGVVGKAVYSREWADRIDSVLANAKSIVQDVRDGKGPLGLILYDEVVRSDLAEAVGNFNEISRKIGDVADTVANQGGLFHFFFMDEEAVVKVRALLDQALMGLEDAREAAPLSSLGSFLFGTF